MSRIPSDGSGFVARGRKRRQKFLVLRGEVQIVNRPGQVFHRVPVFYFAGPEARTASTWRMPSRHRCSPPWSIWPETADLVTALIRRQPRKPDEPIFVNRYRAPLTASGFRFRLRQYVEAAAKAVPTISKKRVTPHIFRHSTAVHLVAAGVDVTVIRSWLGHAQLDTNNHYAQANLETKRKALEQVDPKLRPAKPPRWKRDADLLVWLDSL